MHSSGPHVTLLDCFYPLNVVPKIKALARISKSGVREYSFGVKWVSKFLFIPLHYIHTKYGSILGCPNQQSIGCPKDTRTPLWLKAWPRYLRLGIYGKCMLYQTQAIFNGLKLCQLQNYLGWWIKIQENILISDNLTSGNFNFFSFNQSFLWSLPIHTCTCT